MFLFGSFKLIKNADFGKYKYSGFDIGFDTCGSFALSDGTRFGKKCNNGADMSLSVYVGNRKRDILILGKVSF